MNTWQHLTGMDYLRQRAEKLLNGSRTEQPASEAAGGDRPVLKSQNTVGNNDTVGHVPELGDMTGGISVKE